jgi:uncharacterized membrane protein
MNNWIYAGLTIAILIAYEAFLIALSKRHPERLAREVHAGLREDWVNALAQSKGSEILGVQTLRNSLMSSSLVASTSALGLMGTITLSIPGIQSQLLPAGEVATGMASPKIFMDLTLLLLLFASLVTSVMAARYFNHAGFVVGMPVDSPARHKWQAAGVKYTRRAGILYGIGLRQLLLVAPVIAYILHPVAGPFVALVVIGSLWSFDRYSD